MFIDSNIFLVAYIDQGRKGEQCRDFLKRVEKGEQRSITSVLVFDEVTKVFEAKYGRNFALSLAKKLLSISNLDVVPVDKKIFEDSLKYFESGMMPRDALHVATMRENGVSTILSFDKDFDSVKAISRREP